MLEDTPDESAVHLQRDARDVARARGGQEGDGGTQLFRYYFTIDQVPALVKLLDGTAAELNAHSAQNVNH